MRFDTVIFDLDGTILDTLSDLSDSVNYALLKNNLPSRTKEEVRSFVGNGIRLLIERAVPENTEKSIVDNCFDHFKIHYKGNSTNKTKPYDGIIDVLNELKKRGVKIALVSNKADFAVQELMERFFPGLFDFATGERDGVRRKPYPDSVFAAMEYLGSDKNNTVYIGDSEVDVETAQNCNIPCIAVSWGFREREVLMELNPEYIIDETKEITDVLK